MNNVEADLQVGLLTAGLKAGLYEPSLLLP
jgi:hypothetical protein